MAESADAELLAATVDVADAFDVFYCRRREAVLTYLASRTPDIGTAVDLLAEVFAAAYLDRTGLRLSVGLPAHGCST